MADDTQLAEATQPLSFAEFLERMKEPAAADLVRSIKNFIKTFDERRPEPERDSNFVQSFLTKSEAAFRQHPVWASAPPAHQAQAVEGLEKYLMTKIYHKTFGVSELDRERDEALAVRMAALGFIRPGHLDIPELYQDEKAWVLAMKELHKINNYKAPRDKLVCILNCCRVINNLLHVQVQQGEARGADDFLPVLIYVVIHANPPQLASNLEYIQRFRMHSRMASESAYFFTQLYSAASFIETVNAGSLTIHPDEFVARMVAAGVPDMQLAPNQAAPALLPRGSGGSALAAAAAAPDQASAAAAPPPQAVAAALDHAAAQMPTAGNGMVEAAAGGYALPPAAYGLPASAAPLLPAAIPAAQALPTALEPLGLPSQVEPPLPSISPGLIPAVPAPIPSMASFPAPLPQLFMAPPAPAGGGLAGGSAPGVAELERAGVGLVLAAEAAGRLREQHRFLYAAAEDLRVADVPALLAGYKELVLRYEALSLAVAQLGARSAAFPALAQQQQPQQPQQSQPQQQQGQQRVAFLPGVQNLGPLPQAAAPGEEGAPLETAATAEALAGASETAVSAAETVLQPSTSAGLYSSIGSPHPEEHAPPAPEHAAALGGPGGDLPAPPDSLRSDKSTAGSAAEPEGTPGVHDEDRFLSLANGEAQADAQDMGTPPAAAPAPGAQRANGAPGEAQPRADQAEQHLEQDAGGSPISEAATTQHAEGRSGVAALPASSFAGKAGAAGEQRPARAEEGTPAVALADALQHRTSSTLATAGSSETGGGGPGPEHTVNFTHGTSEGGASTEDVGGARKGGAERGAAASPDQEPGPPLPATSSDADPFRETDLGLKVVPAGQAQGPDMHHMEESHLSTLPVASAAGTPASQTDGAADDLFGGLSVAHNSSAHEAESLI